jgi:hypothetical protein
MKHAGILAGMILLAGSSGSVRADADAPKVRGDYVEARTCSVWVGSCFSNGEANLLGKNAILGWAVRDGSWNGQKLDGLKVVAVLNSEGTLQTRYQGAVASVIYVDKTATPLQAEALVAMAKELAPEPLARVLKVEAKAIAFARKGLEADLTADTDLRLKTGPICHCDSTSCHAYLVYPAFSSSAEVESAKAEANRYQGGGLGVRWSDPDRPSAMVGTFAK